MSFEYLTDPSHGPRCCPGGRRPFPPGQPPFIPDFPQMQAAVQRHDMEFRPDYDWSNAQS